MTPPLYRTNSFTGRALVEKGLISEDQLNDLLVDKSPQKKRLGEAAVASGYISEEDLARFLACYFELPFVDITKLEISSALVELVPEPVARRYSIIVIDKSEDSVVLAMADPLDV